MKNKATKKLIKDEEPELAAHIRHRDAVLNMQGTNGCRLRRATGIPVGNCD